MDTEFEPSQSFTSQEDKAPPPFEDYERGAKTSESAGDSRSSRRERRREQRRAHYARDVQLACQSAIRNIKDSETSLVNKDWSSPLSAAPSAICVMAILLRTAGEENAAGLQVKSKTVMDQNKVLGELPSIYFRTNLQHCSDLGRFAFLEAQKTMNSIQKKAKSMVKENGNISFIIELLEDPEDAKYNLKPEMDSIKDSATECLQEIKELTSRFQYWFHVICHLRLNAMEQGELVGEKSKENETLQEAKRAEEDKSRQAKANAEANIAELRMSLQSARRKVQTAQYEVERLQQLPPLPEPSMWEEAQHARAAIPITAPYHKGKGIFQSAWESLVGQSEEEYSADKRHIEKVERQRTEQVALAREQRENARKAAFELLNEARATERELDARVDQAVQKLAASRNQLAEAQANLARTEAELQRLDDAQLELADIMDILDRSSRELGNLKNHVEELVKFFEQILVHVQHTVQEDVKNFLGPIRNGIDEDSTNPEEVKQLHLGDTAKKRILSVALEMQGSFSAIADVSGAYVLISDRFIRPAIHKMESLSTVEDSKWRSERDLFVAWCKDAVTQIDGLTKSASANLEPNMGKRIDYLHRLAIEAAAEN